MRLRRRAARRQRMQRQRKEGVLFAAWVAKAIKALCPSR